ncbi:TrmH family RNA methyltransferase [Virgibacillus doumboii]|uniref:TrmH family RNA methyltransferase n=1 Tax=Virgibacillus doumboii TaxID=2697503 RepID=UPI0013E0D55D|nr:RNA methyltransferase [Virgibacillus doumboii]
MITSVQNDKVKKWNKLHKRKGREQTGTFFIEGFHLIEEAFNSNWEFVEIIVQEGAEYPSWCNDFPVTFVGENVSQHISCTKTPQGIAAIVKMKVSSEITDASAVLLIDSIQDPGNLGTIIRTADAAGFDAVMLGEKTVDMYNDKVIRSTQGSLFHLPILQVDIIDQILKLKKSGFNVWASSLSNAVSYEEADPGDKTALIVGNEGAGIHEKVVNMADYNVRIPIYGKAESLNVSVAAGILMYYIKR